MSKDVKVAKEANGLEFLLINNLHAEAKISLQGGHVTWWRPKATKQDVLWLSTNARYEKGRSIRGGIPICWPWFGDHPTDGNFCIHGFARVIPWRLDKIIDLKNGSTKLILKMLPTEDALRQLTYNYELELSIVIGESLYLNLKTTNLSSHPFTIGEGFHTYFYVSDIESIKVRGLENMVYTDKFDNFNRNIQKGPIEFKGPFDRVYLNTSNDCYIEDETFNRVITIKKSNSNSTVVWTPGEKRASEMGDMGAKDEWRRMVCVETANSLENSVVIYPDLTHSIATEYSVQEY